MMIDDDDDDDDDEDDVDDVVDDEFAHSVFQWLCDGITRLVY